MSAHRSHRPPRQAGFTLFECILVIGLLGLVAAGLLAMQPSVFRGQTSARDIAVGHELMRACAERLLGVRRNIGYSNVTTTTCDGMGSIGGFAANPTITMVDAGNTAITACASARCTISVVWAKSSGPAAPLSAITLQLSNY